jgi:energy-coupling factor transporter ATP-binding protein EcfA2
VATAALTAILLLVAGSTLLSFLIGKGNDVFVSVVSNALFVPLGALLTLLYFNGGRDRILAYRYRRLAARSPQDLLPGATGDSVRIERSALITEVLVETADSPAGVLHVITGPSGSGKTTLLQSLIQVSAADGFIPIVVQADLGADFANMESCLEASFVTAADRILRAPFDLARAWRTIRTGNRLLVFIDGLDDWRARMGTGAADTLALLQDTAQVTPYRYVVAIRSGDENVAYTYPTYAVGALELDAGVLDALLPAKPFPVDRRARQAWLTAIEATEASRSPLFMKLAVDLVHHRETLESIAQDEPVLARLALLDGWLDRRLRGYAAYHPQAQVDLEDEVMMLARIAFCLTVEGRLEAHMDEIPVILERHGKLPAPPRWRRITRCVQLGQSLELLRGFATQGEDNRRLQFRHSTFQTHLTVLFLRRHAHRYRDHDLQAASEELISALCAYITEASASSATRAICRQGTRALKRGDGGNLAWITVLSSAPRLTARQRRLLLDRIDHQFAAAADSEKVRIVALVAAAAPLGDSRYRLLWDWSRQGGYAIGNSAVRALARGGSAALREVGGEVDRLITANRGKWLYDAATWRTSGGVGTTLSTAVPLWREHVDPGDRHVVESWNRAILDLVAAGQLGGVEVSVIAGFELAARLAPSPDVWTNVVELLRTVRSHDAKLRLLRLFYLHSDTAPYAKRRIIDGFLAEDHHPFVACYASLVRTAPQRSRT